MGKLLIATTNPGKWTELRALLQVPGLVLLRPSEVGAEFEVDESGDTYEANACRKAEAFAQASGLWTVGDDTGLEVDVLGGAPGLHSARAAGPSAGDAERRALLLQRLAAHPRPWRARFRCALALASPQGSVETAHGQISGEIVPEARGQHGFGYDPLFLVDGADLTMAELDLETKNRISHRAQAATALRPRLIARLGLAPPDPP
jgi:XTP/dITP diphosphohydrolase